ncbi:hypothetical protein [Streptomyces sp. NPDC054845]
MEGRLLHPAAVPRGVLGVYSKQLGSPGTKAQMVKWGNVPASDPKNADMSGLGR